MSSKDTSKNSATAIAAPVDDSASGMSAPPPQGWKQSVWKNCEYFPGAQSVRDILTNMTQTHLLW